MIDASCFTPRYDEALVSALRSAGVQVVLLTSRYLYDDKVMKGNADVKRLFFRLCSLPGIDKLSLRYARLRHALKVVEYPLDIVALLVFLIKWRPDIVHFQWVVSPVFDVYLIRLLRRLGYPVAYTAHNILPHDERPGHADQYRAVYRSVDAVIVHSEASKQDLLQLCPEGRATAHVVPHGVFSSSVPALSKQQAREALGLAQDSEVVLLLGAISAYKGLHVLIEAFAAVVQARPSAYLVVAGRPSEDPERYAEQVRQLGLGEHVRLHLGYLADHCVAHYYAAADVVALPYLKIYQSAALMSAFGYGVPVVASNVGGFRDVIEDGKSGYLVPQGDARALAEAIIRLLSDPGQRSNMAEYIRTVCATRYSWASIALQTRDLYEVLRDPGRGASRDGEPGVTPGVR